MSPMHNPCHPGEVLREALSDISVTDAAKHLGVGRVALSRLMLNSASLWILDEPFVALDHASITLLADVIGQHLQRGGMAVLTSHQQVDIPGAKAQTLELGA